MSGLSESSADGISQGGESVSPGFFGLRQTFRARIATPMDSTPIVRGLGNIVDGIISRREEGPLQSQQEDVQTLFNTVVLRLNATRIQLRREERSLEKQKFGRAILRFLLVGHLYDVVRPLPEPQRNTVSGRLYTPLLSAFGTVLNGADSTKRREVFELITKNGRFRGIFADGLGSIFSVGNREGREQLLDELVATLDKDLFPVAGADEDIFTSGVK